LYEFPLNVTHTANSTRKEIPVPLISAPVLTMADSDLGLEVYEVIRRAGISTLQCNFCLWLW